MLTYFFSFWGDFVHSPFDIFAVFGDNIAGFGDNVAVLGDIVAGVDGALASCCRPIMGVVGTNVPKMFGS